MGGLVLCVRGSHARPPLWLCTASMPPGCDSLCRCRARGVDYRYWMLVAGGGSCNRDRRGRSGAVLRVALNGACLDRAGVAMIGSGPFSLVSVRFTGPPAEGRCPPVTAGVLAGLQNCQVMAPADFSHHWCESFSRPVYASKNAFIRQRLETEKPPTPGNSARRSAASCSTTSLPQPWASCRSTISRPMSQYRPTSSLLTALRASYWAERMGSRSGSMLRACVRWRCV